MSKPLDNMNNLMNSLPARDIFLGYKFLENRDFESLKELIDSAVVRVRKNLKSDNPKAEYVAVDLDKLNKLQGIVDVYYLQLVLPNEENEENE